MATAASELGIRKEQKFGQLLRNLSQNAPVGGTLVVPACRQLAINYRALDKQFQLEGTDYLGATDAERDNLLAAVTTALQDDSTYRTRNVGMPGIISNQIGLSNILHDITPIGSDEMPNVAVISRGSFFSILPELAKANIDLVILTDFDVLVLAHAMSMIMSLRLAKRLEKSPKVAVGTNLRDLWSKLAFLPTTSPLQKAAFKINTKALHIAKRVSGFGALPLEQQLIALYSSEAEFDQNAHFLSSQERFGEILRAVQKLKFMAYPLNIMNRAAVEQFRRQFFSLDGTSLARISFFDLSNIHHYCGRDGTILRDRVNGDTVTDWQLNPDFMRNIRHLCFLSDPLSVQFLFSRACSPESAGIELTRLGVDHRRQGFNYLQLLQTRIATGLDSFAAALDADITYILEATARLAKRAAAKHAAPSAEIVKSRAATSQATTMSDSQTGAGQAPQSRSVRTVVIHVRAKKTTPPAAETTGGTVDQPSTARHRI